MVYEQTIFLPETRKMGIKKVAFATSFLLVRLLDLDLIDGELRNHFLLMNNLQRLVPG